MRKQLPITVENAAREDERVVLLYGDVGTYGFRSMTATFSDRTYNVGILEQSMISMAAGLAMQGFIPVVHTIAAFLVERALEQIKDDFGYQKLGGNFVSIGASYDLASWGCTHESPGDVGILKNVPSVEIVVPGTPTEFDSLFRESYADGRPTYFRLSAKSNEHEQPVSFGKLTVVRRGTRAIVLAIGPMLDRVLEACEDLDVTVLYCTTIRPFDIDGLREHLADVPLIVCEPYYSGALADDIAAAAGSAPLAVHYIGVPREFIHKYGSPDDIDRHLKLTAADIGDRICYILGT